MPADHRMLHWQLNRTFRDILFKSETFDTSTTSYLNETGLQEPRMEIWGPEHITGVLRRLCSVMDAFEVQ